MKPEIYFDRMRETSNEVDKCIFDVLEPLKQQNPEIYEAVGRLPRKRVGLPKLRAQVVREAYTVCKKDESSDWISLAAAVELELNAMYYRNQVFDIKAGCSTSDGNSVIRNWSADSYSRDLAEQVLERSYQGSLGLVELLRNANMTFAVGEFRDVLQNVYSYAKDLTFDEQIDLCNQRIYEINASFFEKCAKMGAIVSEEKEDSKISALSNFGRAHGTAGQIMNDITDFVPPRLNAGTTEKTGDDAYSDVKNGKMTYPIIWLLENGCSEEKRLLIQILEKGQDAELSELEKLTKVLMNSGAFKFAKQKVRDYRNEAKRNLHGTFSKIERRYLSTMCTMFDKNRYYDALKKFKN